MLYKPWRNLRDIAPGNSTFETTLNDFVLVNPFLTNVMENVDYFHKCLENAKKKPPGWIPVNEANLTLQQLIPSTEGVDHDDIEWIRLLSQRWILNGPAFYMWIKMNGILQMEQWMTHTQLVVLDLLGPMQSFNHHLVSHAKKR